MILEQHYLDCLSQASYLIADERTRQALVVDPRRDVEAYLERARELGLTIRHVVLTHFHADFLAGHLELARRSGAEIALGRRARADYAFRPLADGDVLELGDVRVEILETPGHTPEGISLFVRDLAHPEAPANVLTGDTLFVGDVGRPDLMASVGVSAEELASMMYDTLHEKLLALPDDTVVWPGHGAGSACGKNLSSETSSTIGAQRRTNHALRPMPREEFVRLVTAGQPAAPAYFPRAARKNREERELLDELLAAGLRALSLDELQEAQREGAQLLDVRAPEDFAAGHLPGSVFIGLGGRFASWAGTVLDPERPIVLVAPEGEERQALVRLARVGLDGVRGSLAGGGAATLAAHPERLARLERVDPAAAARELDGADAPWVLDVRAPGEHEDARIAGAHLVPLPELAARVAEVPTGRRVLVHCKGGYRSMIAMSLLEAAGRSQLADLRGGMDAWLAAGLPAEGAAASPATS